MHIGYRQILHHLYKELEHLLILVSSEGPGTNPLWILRDDYTQEPSNYRMLLYKEEFEVNC